MLLLFFNNAANVLRIQNGGKFWLRELGENCQGKSSLVNGLCNVFGELQGTHSQYQDSVQLEVWALRKWNKPRLVLQYMHLNRNSYEIILQLLVLLCISLKHYVLSKFLHKKTTA